MDINWRRQWLAFLSLRGSESEHEASRRVKSGKRRIWSILCSNYLLYLSQARGGNKGSRACTILQLIFCALTGQMSSNLHLPLNGFQILRILQSITPLCLSRRVETRSALSLYERNKLCVYSSYVGSVKEKYLFALSPLTTNPVLVCLWCSLPTYKCIGGFFKIKKLNSITEAYVGLILFNETAALFMTNKVWDTSQLNIDILMSGSHREFDVRVVSSC